MTAKQTAKRMNENEEKSPDFRALCYLGRAYVIMPRIILERMLSRDKTEAMIGKLHGILFTRSHYEDGYVIVNDKKTLCAKGEYITTYEELAGLLGTSVRSVRRCVIALLDESLIEFRRVNGRSCFRVCGYALFVSVGSTDVAVNAPVSKSVIKKKTPEERREMEELNITKGHQPRFDLLNQLNYEI